MVNNICHELAFFNVDDVKLCNQYNQMNGIDLLNLLRDEVVTTCFFDPQYRGVLDLQKYGNEGIGRGKRRCALSQMDESVIISFIHAIARVLVKSGHLFLWIDKFHLLSGFQKWLLDTKLEIVDMITWEKAKIGMGYRSRRKSEYCVILQKSPKKVKNHWYVKDIPDVWSEKVDTKSHPHSKPLGLQTRLIEATTKENDLIVDPAMGGGGILKACLTLKRNFVGSDLLDRASYQYQTIPNLTHSS